MPCRDEAKGCRLRDDSTICRRVRLNARQKLAGTFLLSWKPKVCVCMLGISSLSKREKRTMKMGRDEIKKHCSTGLQSDQNQLDARERLRPPLEWE